jgi:membrane-associated phospholipid phosphatase
MTGVWGRIGMTLQFGFQRLIEKLFFRGRTTVWSRRVSLWVMNGFVIFGLFLALTQLFLYRWTGGLYAADDGFRLDGVFGGIDNRIPFVPQMAVFYVYTYYPWIFFTMLFFTFLEYEGFMFGVSLFAVGIIAIVVYIFFPVSVHWWRQELFANRLPDNFWAETMYRFYKRDTSFNCFPSLHAAVSTVTACTWFQYWRVKRNSWRLFAALVSAILAAGTILSTLFVKQHYIVDEIAGMALGCIVSYSVYRFLSNRAIERG